MHSFDNTARIDELARAGRLKAPSIQETVRRAFGAGQDRTAVEQAEQEFLDASNAMAQAQRRFDAALARWRQEKPKEGDLLVPVRVKSGVTLQQALAQLQGQTLPGTASELFEGELLDLASLGPDAASDEILRVHGELRERWGDGASGEDVDLSEATCLAIVRLRWLEYVKKRAATGLPSAIFHLDHCFHEKAGALDDLQLEFGRATSCEKRSDQQCE